MKINKDVVEMLTESFPSILKNDVNLVLNILPVKHYSFNLFGWQIFKEDNLISHSFKTFSLNNEILKIPDRIYFDEPNRFNETQLTDTQKIILNCVYLRHYNGFIRQKRLQLLMSIQDYFIIPHTIQLLGEYVIEILEVLDKHINSENINNYVSFIKENPIFWKVTKSRVISYWNEYYRKDFPCYNDYIGKKIINKINETEEQLPDEHVILPTIKA